MLCTLPFLTWVLSSHASLGRLRTWISESHSDATYWTVLQRTHEQWRGLKIQCGSLGALRWLLFQRDSFPDLCDRVVDCFRFLLVSVLLISFALSPENVKVLLTLLCSPRSPPAVSKGQWAKKTPREPCAVWVVWEAYCISFATSCFIECLLMQRGKLFSSPLLFQNKKITRGNVTITSFL